MKKIKENSKTIKAVVITSIVWIALAAAVLAYVKYGEYQHTEGMLQGFESAKQILGEK